MSSFSLSNLAELIQCRIVYSCFTFKRCICKTVEKFNVAFYFHLTYVQCFGVMSYLTLQGSWFEFIYRSENIVFTAKTETQMNSAFLGTQISASGKGAFPSQWKHGVREIRVPRAAGDIRTAHRQCIFFTTHHKTSPPSHMAVIRQQIKPLHSFLRYTDIRV